MTETEDDFEGDFSLAELLDQGWTKGLSEFRIRFVYEYLTDLNAGKAYVRAGGKENSGNASRLLHNPKIARAIMEAMTERAEDLGINAKIVLAEAWRGYTTAVRKKNLGAARQFLELVGKHVDVNAFRHQVGLGGPDGGPVQFDLSGLSTDETRTLLALLEKAGALEGGDEGGAVTGA